MLLPTCSIWASGLGHLYGMTECVWCQAMPGTRPGLRRPPASVHTYTHHGTYISTYKHTQWHKSACTHKYIYTVWHICAYTHTYHGTYVPIHKHKHTHTTAMCAYTLTHTNAVAICTSTHAYIHTQWHICSYTHTETHKHTDTKYICGKKDKNLDILLLVFFPFLFFFSKNLKYNSFLQLHNYIHSWVLLFVLL